MAERAVVVAAFAPHLAGDLFPPGVAARLREAADFDPSAALPGFEGERARGLLARADVLITGWGCPRVDASVLDAAPRLRGVMHAAGSVKDLVSPELFARGVVVSSAAEANARPVADYTVAVIVLATKRVFPMARRPGGPVLPAGGLAASYPAGDDIGLDGSVVGVIGASRIGRLVLDRLAGLPVTTLVSDPYLDRQGAAALGAELVGTDDLFRRADVVTVHAPALPETRHLVDDRRLSLMRDGAILVNTARGSLVDHDALTKHCAAGRVDAVLDVTDPEPLPADHPLIGLPNVLITPHLAGAHGRELRLLGEYAVEETLRLLGGVPLRGQVRPADLAHIA
ncbi:hydroxyacid dehydrogenase [Bailinhaonella thermotolerans]|uniref:Hydroxyacid dehydrogenase n=1 Tax=Bailinhaonella thermotolerans TaxID=1070861 RepID=A0A3A4BJQ5_9ACTN|nr:hydroxyacid dehydrogenase [Bailinhaonella thermotolerans]RJL31462.1 hydroxyacid dehydrogenase [Bailinhaonella thermotolerans]